MLKNKNARNDDANLLSQGSGQHGQAGKGLEGHSDYLKDITIVVPLGECVRKPSSGKLKGLKFLKVGSAISFKCRAQSRKWGTKLMRSRSTWKERHS